MLTTEKQAKILAYIIFVLICYADWLLFKSYILREKAWSPFLNGDANWYLSTSYEVFHHILKNHTLPDYLWHDQRGAAVYLLSSLLYFFFGASRLTALSTNFIFLPLLFLLQFVTIRKISQSWAIALACIGLTLSLALPFQGHGENPLLSIAAYQRDFIGFNLFGIFLCLAIYSNTFQCRKWAVVAGVVAGVLVLVRFNMVFHLVGIYLTFISFLLCRLIWKTFKKQDTLHTKLRCKNSFASFLSMFVIIAYPLYRVSADLYNAYFVGWVVGTINKEYLKLWGYNSFVDGLLYYPKNIYRQGLGENFSNIVLCISILVIGYVIVHCYERYVKKTTLGSLRNSIILEEGTKFNVPIFLLFIVLSMLIPLIILNIFPGRAWNAATFLTAPPILIGYVILAATYRIFYVPLKIWSRYIGILIAVIALGGGMGFQIKQYSMASNSTHHRDSYQDVARLYDDIVLLAQKRKTNTPKISVNYLDNYVLGGAIALTAYQYEKTGELFRTNPRLGGGDITKGIELDAAKALLHDSDIAVFSIDKSIIKSPKFVNCDPLQDDLASYKTSKSLLALHDDLLVHLRNNFVKKGRYKICGRHIELHIHKNFVNFPTNVKVSSVSNLPYSLESLINGSHRIWHSKVHPTYPQWVELAYDNRVAVDGITMSCQPGGSGRAPRWFKVQGENSNGKWIDLLEVKDAKFSDGNESNSWPMTLTKPYLKFRILVLENNGAKELVTIKSIKLHTKI